jgi:hypothetical protein
MPDRWWRGLLDRFSGSAADVAPEPARTGPLPPCGPGEAYPCDLKPGMRVVFPGADHPATVSMPGIPDSTGKQLVLSDDDGHCKVWLVCPDQRLRLDPGHGPDTTRAEAVRAIPCVYHAAMPGVPCDVTGDCMTRWISAFRLSLITRDDLVTAFRAVLAVTRLAIVPAGAVA